MCYLALRGGAGTSRGGGGLRLRTERGRRRSPHALPYVCSKASPLTVRTRTSRFLSYFSAGTQVENTHGSRSMTT